MPTNSVRIRAERLCTNFSKDSLHTHTHLVTYILHTNSNRPPLRAGGWGKFDIKVALNQFQNVFYKLIIGSGPPQGAPGFAARRTISVDHKKIVFSSMSFVFFLRMFMIFPMIWRQIAKINKRVFEEMQPFSHWLAVIAAPTGWLL